MSFDQRVFIVFVVAVAVTSMTNFPFSRAYGRSRVRKKTTVSNISRRV